MKGTMNMILSVFNWNTLDFDYYKNDAIPDQGGWYELQGLGIGTQSQDSGVGMDIESALPSLPSDAIYIGSGAVAKGRVCVKRDSNPRGEQQSSSPKTMSGTIFGGRLVNLQTIPEKDRVKFNQDRDRHLLDYSGPNFLQVQPENTVPDRVNVPTTMFPTLLGSTQVNQIMNENPIVTNVIGKPLGDNNTPTDQETKQEPCECKKEIPLALFLVPIIAGTSAGYLLGSKGSNIKTIMATGLGLLFGVTAGIQLGREYEGYKMSTYLNKK